ncbi:DUF2231 domain-containing protein [Sphingomonas piscis]|uniref:DUF2231 domain-containing protein n=1 Tax=Sphingomonas piscis TaxID=2714943 RepID=A0A6G7YND9_9SPHN|nr:DUF2231 domain-containing protein [Sphingomonas piscis]QIK78236.1 DUF2231 domain-containing protein [Sphingomonas piscis]
MNGRNPKSTAQIAGHPMHPMLVPLPIACFIGALVTDVIFLATDNSGWPEASKWLLGFGIATAALAATTGIIDYMGDDRIRRTGDALKHMMANVAVVVIEIINLVTRLSNDAADDGVGSLGVFLSLAAVVVLGYSGWKGGDLVYKHRVGVHDTDDEPATTSVR